MKYCRFNFHMKSSRWNNAGDVLSFQLLLFCITLEVWVSIVVDIWFALQTLFSIFTEYFIIWFVANFNVTESIYFVNELRVAEGCYEQYSGYVHDSWGFFFFCICPESCLLMLVPVSECYVEGGTRTVRTWSWMLWTYLLNFNNQMNNSCEESIEVHSWFIIIDHSLIYHAVSTTSKP